MALILIATPYNMVWCFKTPKLRPRRTSKPSQPKSSTIEIYTESSRSPTGKWCFAELSFDNTSETNIVSQKLIQNVLHKTVQPLDKETREWIARNNACDKLEEGYVDLVWCFERTPRRVHGPTRFIVSAAYDPPYDAILGREDSVKYGIAKKSKGKDCG